MRFKLNEQQFVYLNDNFLSVKMHLSYHIQIEKVYNYYYLEMNEDTIEQVCDWVNDEMDMKGFDSNYELTQEGQILESLIDMFISA